MKNAVLFVSPSVEDARTLAPMLAAVGIPFSHVTDLSRATELLESKLFGAVLTEANLSDGTWKDLVGKVGQIKRRVAVVVTDLLADARFWVDVLDFGAYDVLPKPFYRREVQRVLANALDSPPLTKVASAA